MSSGKFGVFLACDAGWLEVGGDGSVDLSCDVGFEAIREFSQRRNEMDEVRKALESGLDGPSPTTRRTPLLYRREPTRSPATRPNSASLGRNGPIASASILNRASIVTTEPSRSITSPMNCRSGCFTTSSTQRKACVHAPTRSARATC